MAYQYRGNIHIHSSYSDGSGTVLQIAKAAEKAGLDFVIITDHRNLTGYDNGEEGYYGKTLVLIGSEINWNKNHYLGLGISQVVPDNEESPQEVIDGVNEQGGLGFIAHPFEKASYLFDDGKTYPWDNWKVTGYSGVTVWSLASQWKGELTGVLRALYISLINPHLITKNGPDEETIRKWDQLLKERLVVGIGCSDAHAIKMGKSPLTFTALDYYYSFRCVNTHVLLEHKLTGDLKKDKSLVYQALGTGNCFFSYDYFKNPQGFNFTGKSKGQEVPMGGRGRAEEGLVVRLPNTNSLVMLRRNGKEISRKVTARGIMFFGNLTPGVYRVEVYHKHWFGYRAWIYSNPIYLE
ncbi:MAG: PHP domain-containing protein [Chitinophagales bacterium]